jgi:hypothetical protein
MGTFSSQRAKIQGCYWPISMRDVPEIKFFGRYKNGAIRDVVPLEIESGLVASPSAGPVGSFGAE